MTYIADKPVTFVLACGHTMNYKKGTEWRESPKAGRVHNCLKCATPRTTVTWVGFTEDYMDTRSTENFNAEDPTAAIQAWASRMALKHGGDKVYDQERCRYVSWVEALLFVTFGFEKTWLVAPVFDSDTVEAAMAWGEASVSRPEWPRRFLPKPYVGRKQCSLEDHEFRLVKESGDIGFFLTCIDRCTDTFARWNIHSHSYVWNPCAHFEEEFNKDDSSIAIDLTAADFTIRVNRVIEWDGDEFDEADVTYFLEPTFQRNSQVCGSCGREMRTGRRALSRRDSAKYVCSPCGRREALEDFEAHRLFKEEEERGVPTEVE